MMDMRVFAIEMVRQDGDLENMRSDRVAARRQVSRIDKGVAYESRSLGSMSSSASAALPRRKCCHPFGCSSSMSLICGCVSSAHANKGAEDTSCRSP